VNEGQHAWLPGGNRRGCTQAHIWRVKPSSVVSGSAKKKKKKKKKKMVSPPSSAPAHAQPRMVWQAEAGSEVRWGCYKRLQSVRVSWRYGRVP